ncbi:MAG: hypothetical protein JO365_03485 [Bradyrhizobium sp.]|nr:hypothetical protein [Bradyrhizobium sp.]
MFAKKASRHLAAELRAFLAGVHAFFHAVELRAVLRAGAANLRAQRTHLAVKLALVHDEIGGCRADGGAIDHQAEMLRRHMLATFVQAVRHRHAEAGLVAVKRSFDAILFLPAERVHMGVPRCCALIIARAANRSSSPASIVERGL